MREFPPQRYGFPTNCLAYATTDEPLIPVEDEELLLSEDEPPEEPDSETVTTFSPVSPFPDEPPLAGLEEESDVSRAAEDSLVTTRSLPEPDDEAAADDISEDAADEPPEAALPLSEGAAADGAEAPPAAVPASPALCVPAVEVPELVL